MPRVKVCRPAWAGGASPRDGLLVDPPQRPPGPPDRRTNAATRSSTTEPTGHAQAVGSAWPLELEVEGVSGAEIGMQDKLLSDVRDTFGIDG